MWLLSFCKYYHFVCVIYVLFLRFIYFICVYLHVRMCSNKDVSSPGTRVPGGCELLCSCLEASPVLCEKQQVLSTEPSPAHTVLSCADPVGLISQHIPFSTVCPVALQTQQSLDLGLFLLYLSIQA